MEDVAGAPAQHLAHAVGDAEGRVVAELAAEGHVVPDGLLQALAAALLLLLPPGLGHLVPDSLGAQPAEPPPAELGLHAGDVLTGAVLPEPTALALGRLDLHASARWNCNADGSDRRLSRTVCAMSLSLSHARRPGATTCLYKSGWPFSLEALSLVSYHYQSATLIMAWN